ncbi:MAG: hypothetical protein GY788_17285 [bacterium]|nr:hypothetical protein [bacterium]
MAEHIVPVVIPVVGFIVTIGVVVWQVRKGFSGAIEQNKRSEADKLKLDIYKNLNAKVSELYQTEVALTLIPANIKMEFTSHEIYGTVPKTTSNELMEKSESFHQVKNQTISSLEAWSIVNPKLFNLFQTALNATGHDIDTAFQEYFQESLPILPEQNANTWSPPSNDTLSRLNHLGDELQKHGVQFGAYVHDLRVEMQNELVGDLFEKEIPRRRPMDPQIKVIRGADHDALMNYFENETAWGRAKAESEGRVRDSMEQQAQ